MIISHVPPGTDSAVAEVRLTASPGVSPPKTLSALWSGVLVYPWERAADLTVEEYVLVNKDFQIASNTIIFKIKFDCSIGALVASGRDNPYWSVDDLKFSEKSLMQDLISKLPLCNFLVVRVETGDRGPFDAAD